MPSDTLGRDTHTHTHTHYHTYHCLLHHRYAGTHDGTTVYYLKNPPIGQGGGGTWVGQHTRTHTHTYVLPNLSPYMAGVGVVRG